MVYMGSKSRISNYLKPIIENYLKDCKGIYIEPFVGGANMIDKINYHKKIGYDINKYLIALLNKMKSNEDIEYFKISKDKYYNDWKYPFWKGELKNKEDWLIGFVGFTKSFNSIFMHSYGGRFIEKGKIRYKEKETYNNIIKQRKQDLFKICDFKVGNYLDIEIPNGSVVYCDPPYINTEKYKFGDFNHNIFWEWVRNISKKNIVLVSEKVAPDDFEIIWEKEINHHIGQKLFKATEKLFKYKGE